MLNKTPFAYYFEKESKIHKYNPIIKMLTLFVLLIICIFPSKITIISLGLITLVSCILSYVPLRKYLYVLWSTKFAIIIAIVTCYLVTDNIERVILTFGGLILFIIYYGLIIYTTKIIDIIAVFARLFAPIKKTFKKFNENNLASTITVMFMLLPIYKASEMKILISQMSRGYDYSNSSPFEKLTVKIKNFPIDLKYTIKKAYRIIEEMNRRLILTANVSEKYNIKFKKLKLFNRLYLLVLIIMLIYTMSVYL